MTGWTLRREQVGDEAAIHDLVKRAFAPMPFADGDEQELVDALRAAGELVLSLVAVDATGTIIGQIGFSPVTIDHVVCGWFQLSPVAVSPEVQRSGVGSALIEAGIAMLTAEGAAGIAVVGNPAYYERFGFQIIPGLAPGSHQDWPYFRAIILVGDAPRGILRYAAAFG